MPQENHQVRLHGKGLSGGIFSHVLSKAPPSGVIPKQEESDLY